MYKYYFITVFCLGYIQYSLAQIAVFEVQTENLLQMQKGLGWPHELTVAEGQDALMRLSRTIANQQTCSVTTPSGVTFNVNAPPNNRYDSWAEGCGVRVRDVVEADEGRWRLTSARGNDSIVGWTEVYVERDTTSYTGPHISLQDGQTHTDVLLTTLENSYCVVAQPFSDSSLVSGECRVTLDRATRAVQGNWNVLLGLPGKVEELHVERQVSVNAERLDVGYVHDANTNKLHLYCNILHTAKNITFCRFQKTSSASGFNVMDGLSDGTHSYYGEGFLKQQCGMTIESPTAQDYGTWRCSVGVHQWVGTHRVTQTPMQALISVAPNAMSARINREVRMDDVVAAPVFVQGDQPFTVMCRAHVSLTYCWFQHPNGSQYTPTPIVDEEQLYWYTGQNLQIGDCGITFSHATEEVAGEWTCHMGPRNELGVEVIDKVRVRVTGPLAANENEIETIIGGSTTLYCHTSNGNRPLDYCRFLTPRFVGMNVDPSVNKENAIMDRFYFTPDKELDHGDCSLTIDPVHPDDIGEWSCAALINEDTAESRDTIVLYLGESSRKIRLQASLIGMGVGLAVLAIALAGFLGYKKWGFPLPLRRPTTGRRPSSQQQVVSLDNVSNDGSF